MPENFTKMCTKCGAFKPLSDFFDWRGIVPPLCKDCYRVRSIAYKLKQRARCLAEYGQICNPDWRLAARNKTRELREFAIRFYGGKCECCGESNSDKLTFDHINGDGKTDRNKGYQFYFKVVAQGYPNGKYRLLCWSCNFAVGRYSCCPHKGSTYTYLSAYQANSRVVKAEMIAAYGGACVGCGETTSEFLTVDHLNGGGKQHRKTLHPCASKGGAGFNYWLRRQGFPKDEYQLLCFNCNAAKGLSKQRDWGNSSSGDVIDLGWRARLYPTKIESCMICGKPVHGLGCCAKHYQRYKTYGNPLMRRRSNQKSEVIIADD